MPPPPGQDPTALSFQVLAEIAAGESAKVDLCRVTSGPADGRLVAVKRLHPHLATDPAFVAQFRDEMWMTAALRHPNVVEVVGWGTDDQGLYLAVELVQGVSLARLMKTIFDTGEAFTERMVVFLARQVCRGLGVAHALRTPSGELMNLVHRDLTPGNVLCSFQGDVKIADFGLAKAKQRLTRTLTGMVKGQLEYISPEQATGTNIDARADIFSLGVMLFELFAGRRPWVAPNDMELARKLMTEPPADLFKLRPKIDRELVSIVNKCLAKDPKARFQSVTEILARLDEWLSAHGYMEDNEEALGRFVRRNAMRQMAWFERAIAGGGASAGLMNAGPESLKVKPRPPTFTGASVAVPPAKIIPPAADSAPPTERPGTKRSASPFQVKAAARPGSPNDEETTADVKPAAGARLRAPAIAPKIQAKSTGDGEVDWGEEVPTLVKGAAPPQLAKLRQAFKGGKAFDPKLASEMSGARPEPIDEGADTAKRAPLASATIVEGQPPAGAFGPDDAVDSSENVTAPRGDLRLPPQRPAHGSSPDVSQPSPATTRSAGSAPPPPPLAVADPAGDERLRVESERLSLEAVRLAEEAKAAYARAERKAALAKATQDAATIAADALRMGRSAGIAEGLRRLEVALAMERSARANEGAAAAGVSTPPPTGLLAMAPPPIPPAPRMPSGAPPAAAGPSAPPPAIPAPPAIPPAPPVPGRSVPPPAASRVTPTPSGAADGAAGVGITDRQAMRAPVLGSDADVFATQLRPRVMGLPLPVLLAIAVGIVVVVLVVLLIAFG